MQLNAWEHRGREITSLCRSNPTVSKRTEKWTKFWARPRTSTSQLQKDLQILGRCLILRKNDHSKMGPDWDQWITQYHERATDNKGGLRISNSISKHSMSVANSITKQSNNIAKQWMNVAKQSISVANYKTCWKQSNRPPLSTLRIQSSCVTR